VGIGPPLAVSSEVGRLRIPLNPQFGSIKPARKAVETRKGEEAGAVVREDGDRVNLTGSRTLLLVEDDGDIRELVRFWIPDGIGVLDAPTLRDARRHLERTRPDVVILDLHLPDGGGEELLASIPPGVPVIAMTASGRIVTSPGRVVSFLPKPFRGESLQMLVESAMRRVNARRPARAV
jgi:CheY-like chemotaxis protein